jgi:Pilus formation protein N terminal region
MKSLSVVAWILMIVVCAAAAGQSTKTQAEVSTKTVVEGRPATLRLSPQLTTTIRLPEPANSVVVGDPTLFQAEYSVDEPLLVFVKPFTPSAGESNLVISTVSGRQFLFLLKNIGGAAADPPWSADTFPRALVPETLNLTDSVVPDVGTVNTESSPLDGFILRQRARPVDSLTGNDVKVGIGEVQERGSRLVVSFSVVNSGKIPIELVPPQVQLANQTQSGLFRRTRWNTVQQLPVDEYQITSRRLAPGERVDGALIFERPSIKQSNESLFLQIADSAAVDRPTLVPISFRTTTPTGEKP